MLLNLLAVRIEKYNGEGTVFDGPSGCPVESHSDRLSALKLLLAALLYIEGGVSPLWRIWVNAHT